MRISKNQKNYDIVILNDGNFDYINNLMKEIIK